MSSASFKIRAPKEDPSFQAHIFYLSFKQLPNRFVSPMRLPKFVTPIRCMVFCVLILFFGFTLVHAYDYPQISPIAVTVLGTSKAMKAKVPRDIPVEEFDLTRHPERDIPDVLWRDEALRYSFVAQDGPAPLIFVIAGTGASHNSPK